MLIYYDLFRVCYKFILLLMTTKEVQSDSLLSNISNITVKINHNRNDGSGFFNSLFHDNNN